MFQVARAFAIQLSCQPCLVVAVCCMTRAQVAAVRMTSSRGRDLITISSNSLRSLLRVDPWEFLHGPSFRGSKVITIQCLHLSGSAHHGTSQTKCRVMRTITSATYPRAALQLAGFYTSSSATGEAPRGHPAAPVVAIDHLLLLFGREFDYLRHVTVPRFC